MRLTNQQLSGPLAESWRVAAQYFGSDHTEIIDNLIPKQDRAHLYRLEDAGFLEERVETNLIFDKRDGMTPTKEWRTHYWRLKPNGHRNASP
jgi:hypothetical protein